MKKNVGLIIVMILLISIALIFISFAISAPSGIIEVVAVEENAALVDSLKDRKGLEELLDQELESILIHNENEDTFKKQFKYNQYAITDTYVVVLGSNVNVRAKPNISGEVLATFNYGEKINYLHSVEDITGELNNNTWHAVHWEDSGEKRFGFLNDSIASLRSFQFQKMYKEIFCIEEALLKGSVTYINNYKDNQGKAPLWQGGEKDALGNIRSQSAPAYRNLNNANDFIYIEDGSMIQVAGEHDQYKKIVYLKDGKEYYVPSKYVSSRRMDTLNLVIAVDRQNQNEAVFEKIDGEWVVISLGLATTGDNGEYKQETPLGAFFGIEIRPRFFYLRDGTDEVAGYAPYALRFAGGGYIHGVPVQYDIVDGRRIDPGIKESSNTLGTMPLSHKCVRNHTSHAKFIYDSFVVNKTAVVVIE